MDARPEALADMELCALDALRMDGTPIAPQDLRRRYGFSQADVDAYADRAIAGAARIFEREKDAPVIPHVAGAGAAGALPVRRR